MPLSTIGSPRGKVSLVPHSSGWKRSFTAERKKLQRVLGDDAADIQHVGSTAIPGLKAKPVIDIALTVSSFKKLEKHKEALANIGYIHKEDDNRPDRWFFPKGPVWRRTHYLHAGEWGSKYIEDMVLFRDYVLTHPEVKERYEAVKEQLAESYADNRREYTAKKEAFVNDVVRKARRE